MNSRIEIPPSWERLAIEKLSGLLMVIGAPDSGKSTFARYLYSRLCAYHERTAFIDGDVGQATLGPPTTMTLIVQQNHYPAETPSNEELTIRQDGFTFKDDLPNGEIFRVFVGSTSPRGHMLQTVIGLHKLTSQAYRLGATAIVLDTTGLVAQEQGGGILKLCKIDLLEPKIVFAIRRDRELEHILIPLRRSARTSLIELSPAPTITPRDFATRRAHRVSAFRRYFSDASPLELQWTRFAVVPAPAFHPGRVVALEDSRGFSIGLGIVLQVDRPQRMVSILTPTRSTDRIDTIKLGNIWLDAQTFEERRRWEILNEKNLQGDSHTESS